MADFSAICPVAPGDTVKINGDIDGIVEQVQFHRGMERPMVIVEFWHEGGKRAEQMHLDDVTYVLEEH